MASRPAAAASSLEVRVQHFSTERLVARDWAVADAPSAFAIYGREEVARWLGAPPRRPVSSLAEMRSGMDRLIARNAAQPGFGLWPLELRDTGELVGAVLLQPLPGSDGEVEIGWHLNPDHWGHGYATEAGRGAIAVGLRQRGLPRLLAVVDPGNQRSRAVCRRLGMTHHGQTDRYYGMTAELFSIGPERAGNGG
jgi:RimJ/RimL family protein N-acetyltransferase